MQSKLAGADSIKLAFVTRENLKETNNHLLVNMESYTPDELAMQAGLNIDNCWGILRVIIDTLKAGKDGSYYIIKNPNEKEIDFYRVPDEDEDEESSEEEDSDEDGDSDEES